MRRSVLSILLSVSLLCSSIPMGETGQAITAVAAAEESQDNEVTGTGWKFQRESGVLTITDADVVTTDYESETAVPWAEYKSNIRSIQLEEGVTVTKIGAYALGGLTNMEEFALPSEVTEFGVSALEGNGKWGNEVNITVKRIGARAFYGCAGITGSITCANSITVLPERCFANCFKIESITLPKYLQKAGEGDLAYCESLTEITLPSTLTELPDSFLQGCTGITQVTVPSKVTTIGAQTFGYSGLKEIEIPSSVTSLGERAFTGTKIERIVIPETVLTIGVCQFWGCQNLKYVEFGNKNYTEDTLKKGGNSYTIDGIKVVFDQTFYQVPEDAFIICDGTTYDTLNSYRNVYNPDIWSSESSYEAYSDYGWNIKLYRPDDDTLIKEYEQETQAAAALQESDYDADDWAAFQRVLSEAEILVQSGEQIDEKFLNQIQARKNVIEGAKIFLQRTYDQLKEVNEGDYDNMSDSWWDYQDALDDAVRVLASETTNVQAIAQTEKNLRKTVEELEFAPTDAAEAALGKVIEAANALKAADYTEGSWKVLQDAIAEAEALKVTGTISQIEAAQKKVESAVEELVKVSSPQGPDNSSVTPTKNPGAGNGNSSVQKPQVKKVSIKKVSSSKKKTLLVTWKKLSGVTGYQVQIATNKKFTKGKKSYTVKKAKTTKKTVKKLKRKKTYYVRVRAYQTVKGEKHYGSWSASKKKKTK